ncbi:MAG: serine/threonine-protein kinase [Pirellulales bacterium]
MEGHDHDIPSTNFEKRILRGRTAWHFSTEPGPAETPSPQSLEVASTHRNSIEQAGFQLPREVSSADQPVTVGEYRLLEQLGSGGMGVVYKAIHRRLDRFVAIKFPRFAAVLDRRSAARFLREAMLIGRLAHPHIVRALDAGESLYGPYLVTEFIDGETIDVLVRRAGPLPFEQAVKLVEQAARALAYAHSQDIVHRDIKPSNMLLDEAGVLRIVDFGLAKLLADDGRKVETSQNSDGTEFGTFLGTVGYAAPEQLRPDQMVDHRADIYGLGCVLYFMLTGEAPHKGTIADRLLTHRRSRASTLRFGRNDLPLGFEKTWQGMVADSPRSRFSSMLEVEQAMQSALVDRPRRRNLQSPVLNSCERRVVCVVSMDRLSRN